MLGIKLHLPGSEASRLCWDAGACERGPGVPGDRTSSLTGPPYDNDDDGGLCNQKQYLDINDDMFARRHLWEDTQYWGVCVWCFVSLSKRSCFPATGK